jgi:PAS domain S-box-containing protein
MDRHHQILQGEQQVGQAVLDTLPLGLFVLDRQWHFLYLNDHAGRLFEQLCGHSRAQLLGNNFWEVCPEVADSTFSREFNQALADQRPFALEVYYAPLNRWFEVVASPAVDIRCFYFRDITDRVRLERELRVLAEQLTQASHARLVSPEAVRGLLTAFDRTARSRPDTILEW